MTRQINSEQYRRAFGLSEEDSGSRQENALAHALEIRKFEIELYWKRATYFWTFIAAAFAAYGVIQASKDIAQKEHLSVLVAVLGFVFSFAWQSVNRGSKQWQEKQGLTGPSGYSVSKINQIVSIFVTVIWVLLIWQALPTFTKDATPDLFLVLVIFLAASLALQSSCLVGLTSRITNLS